MDPGGGPADGAPRGGRHRSPVAVTGLAVTGAASRPPWRPPARAAVIPAWRIVKQVHASSGDFNVSSPSVRAAAGRLTQRRAAPRRPPGSAADLPGPKSRFLARAMKCRRGRGRSSADVWAFTGGGSSRRALHWNGHTWTVQRSFPGQIGGAIVISRSDVWVFGEPYFPGAGLGAWHYNGRSWSRVASGHGLEGGSALPPNNIWAFGGSDIAHWNGSTWSRTSVAYLLPAKQELNDPAVSGSSRCPVTASTPSGTAACRTRAARRGAALERPPVVQAGRRPLTGSARRQISSDGHGGLWLPMPGAAARSPTWCTTRLAT